VRKLSKIGAVLVAVFALTAIGASAAQATESTFGWASGTTKIDGSQDPASPAQIFKVTSEPKAGEFKLLGEFNCNTVVASALVSGTGATSVTSTAGTLTYNNSGSADKCPASLGEATITTHNCQYQFTPGLSTSAGHSTGSVDIVGCPTTAPIEVNVAGICLVKISNQTGIGPVKYTTTATTPSTITAEINAVNTIAVTGTGVCAAAKFGDYSGNVIFEGTNAKAEQTAIKILP
jgi:hypothetical protein